jgi:hypothetical protein
MIGAQRGIVGLAVALFVGWGGGCGSGAPPVSSSMEEATVQGTVTVKGKPLTRGKITFDPANIKRKVAPRSAPIGPNGAYTIKTLIGENSVTVQGPTIDRDPNLALNQRMVDVESGENQVPIELSQTNP